MESTATKFIELIKRLRAVPTVAGGTNAYSCRSLPCVDCCYLAENCADLRIKDFPQSLEYHRKTYPEDFV